MSKRYTVISQLTKRGPEYRIFDQLYNVTIEGDWKCEKWAESVAEMMEEKWRHEQDKGNSKEAKRSRRE